MIVSDEARLVFVHVQKTGGVSVEHWLRDALPDARRLPGRDRHAGLRTILADEPALTDYFVVGFVRNPWARMLSWHRMLMRWASWVPAGEPLSAVENFRGNHFAQRVVREYADFEGFVMRAPDEMPRLRRPQVAYLEAPGRRADLVGRQERLAADLERVRERCGLPARSLEQRNTDEERVDHRDAYTPVMRDRVATLFARDVAELGYEF